MTVIRKEIKLKIAKKIGESISSFKFSCAPSLVAFLAWAKTFERHLRTLRPNHLD
jgi:hypothetical protein